MSQVLLFATFTLQIDRKYLSRYFLLIGVRLGQKNGFCVLVDVHEMAKNGQVRNNRLPKWKKNRRAERELWQTEPGNMF